MSFSSVIVVAAVEYCGEIDTSAKPKFEIIQTTFFVFCTMPRAHIQTEKKVKRQTKENLTDGNAI